ncbi:hypothetical protein C4K38_3155 [Pseudomonas chlororaphis subsp. piscium]|nr:hypothetical protein C4K38_3155 [Pseudomonas chlororaphis subsp. piscium]
MLRAFYCTAVSMQETNRSILPEATEGSRQALDQGLITLVIDLTTL